MNMADPFAPGLLARLPEVPRKVAVLRASRIGDFLCTTPALRALRAALPQAEITLITLPLLRELVLRSPHVDRYIAFPGFPGMAEQFFDARNSLQFFQEMQAERFDLAIQMQGSGVYSNPFMLLLGARATAGFIRPGTGAGRLAAALPWPAEGHEVQRMLSLVMFLGAPAQGEKTEFPIWPQDHQAAEALLTKARQPLIGLHTAARDATRRWPAERFLMAAMELVHRYGGTLIVIGEETERCVGDALAWEVGANHCINLAGKTSLPVLGAVIARLAVLLTNDTGPAHIAYALGVPTVTIFGGASLRAYGPPAHGPFRPLVYDVPCRPCGYAVCPIGDLCLHHITVVQVLQAVEEVMGDAWS